MDPSTHPGLAVKEGVQDVLLRVQVEGDKILDIEIHKGQELWASEAFRNAARDAIQDRILPATARPDGVPSAPVWFPVHIRLRSNPREEGGPTPASDVVEFFALETVPELRKYVPPKFPAYAMKKGREGDVFVQFIVGTDGRVEETTVLRGDDLLRAAAIEAVEQWEYEPAMKGGEPVRVRMTVPIRFKMSASDGAEAGAVGPKGSVRSRPAPIVVTIEPNPFNPETVIRYEVKEAGDLFVAVYKDLGDRKPGARVRTLAIRHHEPGSYEILWDGKDEAGNDVPTGRYLCGFLRNDTFHALYEMTLER